MGFLDSLKSAVSSITKELSGEAKTEREKEEALLSKIRKEYFEILAPYVYTYGDRNAIYKETFQKNVLRHAGITEINEKALSQLRCASDFTEAKELRRYADKYSAPETKASPNDVLDLIVPGISQQLIDGIGPALDEAGKYDDYKIYDQLRKLTTPLDSWKVGSCIKAVMIDTIKQELERKILEKNEKICRKLAKDYRSPFEYFYNEEKTASSEVKNLVFLGMAYRIANLAKCYAKREYTPISKDEWESLVEKHFGDQLANLSPEGQKSKRSNYSHYFCRSFFCCDAPACSDLIYDVKLYLSYIEIFEKDKCDDVASICANLKIINDKYAELEREKIILSAAKWLAGNND